MIYLKTNIMDFQSWKEYKEKNSRVFIALFCYFLAEGCPPCEQMKKELKINEKSTLFADNWNKLIKDKLINNLEEKIQKLNSEKSLSFKNKIIISIEKLFENIEIVFVIINYNSDDAEVSKEFLSNNIRTVPSLKSSIIHKTQENKSTFNLSMLNGPLLPSAKDFEKNLLNLFPLDKISNYLLENLL